MTNKNKNRKGINQMKELIIEEFNSRTTGTRKTVASGDRKFEYRNGVTRNSVIRKIRITEVSDYISFIPFSPIWEIGIPNYYSQIRHQERFRL